LEVGTRTLQRAWHGELCLGFPFFKNLLPTKQLGIRSPHSNALMIGYESFIIEVGLYGNTMGYEYKKHSILATDNTWFKNVWELVSYVDVHLHFNEDFQLKPIRQKVIYL
jgi:hypothetical protein